MSLLNSRTRGLTPYIPGEQPQDKKYIKINTNENPYPPSPRVIQAAKEAAGHDLRLYPDPEMRAFRDALALVEGLDVSHVFTGNSSDEVLAMCFQAFFEPDAKPVLFPDITYSFYPVFSQANGVNYREIPLDDEFCIRTQDYAQPNGGIIFPNPNAPTGIALGLEEIERLAQLTEGVLVVDEAYIAFGAESAACLLDRYPNLLIVRTFSKSHALAGMRLGYALGSPELIDGLNRVKNSFNSYTLDRIALACGVEAALDTAYYSYVNQRVASTRDHVAEELTKLGFRVLPSRANFVFISHEKKTAVELFRLLKEQGILVRHFPLERIHNWLRVSIGTDDDMNSFLHTVRSLIP